MARAIYVLSKIVSVVFMMLGVAGSVYFSYRLFFDLNHPAVALVLPVFIFVSLVLLLGGIALHFASHLVLTRIRQKEGNAPR